MPENCLDFEVDPDCRDEGGRERIVCVTEQERSLPYTRVTWNIKMNVNSMAIVGGVNGHKNLSKLGINPQKNILQLIYL